MLPQYFAYISVFTSLFGGYFYVRDTLRGTTKPNRVSWLIWFIAPATASIVLFAKGGGVSALPVFMAGCIPLFVLVASFWNKQSYWELHVLDYVCLVLSIVALLSWFIFQEGTWATLFAILADGIAFLPTYIKTWSHPETETITSYYSGGFNAALSLATLSHISFVTAGFALYLFIGNIIEIGLIFARKVKV